MGHQDHWDLPVQRDLTAHLDRKWCSMAPAGPLGPLGPDGPLGPLGPAAPRLPVKPRGPVGPDGPTAPGSACIAFRARWTCSPSVTLHALRTWGTDVPFGALGTCCAYNASAPVKRVARLKLLDLSVRQN